MKFALSIYFAAICTIRFIAGNNAQLVFKGVPDWHVESVAEGPLTNVLVRMAVRELIRRDEFYSNGDTEY